MPAVVRMFLSLPPTASPVLASDCDAARASLTRMSGGDVHCQCQAATGRPL
ncbi:hypothetical protein OH76DRAFT_1395156, partial [Lentinus brumalis]